MVACSWATAALAASSAPFCGIGSNGSGRSLALFKNLSIDMLQAAAPVHKQDVVQSNYRLKVNLILADKIAGCYFSDSKSLDKLAKINS